MSSFPHVQYSQFSQSAEPASASSKLARSRHSATEESTHDSESAQRNSSEHPHTLGHERLESGSDGMRDYGEQRQSSRRKKEHMSHSGGFLLASIPSDSGDARAQGKENAPSWEIHDQIHNGSVGRRRANAPRSHGVRSKKSKGKGKESIGRSPLGIEVTSPEDHTRVDLGDNVPTGEALDATTSQRPDTTHRNSSVFNADQAQIVSLALNLSESRRRQFSAARLSPADPAGSPRVPSSAALSPVNTAGPTIDESLRQRLKHERRSPRTFSKNFDKSVSSDSPRSSFGYYDERSSGNHSLLKPLSVEGSLPDTVDFFPSEATLLRVQKAKITLELSYEYRRLLQYLPRLPTAEDQRPISSRSAVHQSHDAVNPFGRPYNPLQYIRNRKVRGRERSLLNAEGEGWKEVDNVRAWVDKIADKQQTSGPEAAEDCTLPSFPINSKLSSTAVQSPGPAQTVGGSGSSTRELRPHMDWVTTPWDMLADACWLEQARNKALLEDRQGRKMFGSQRSKAITFSGGMKAERPLSQRSMSLPRSAKPTEGSIDSDARLDMSKVSERGRPRHQRLQSFTSSRDYSSSRDRRNVWRRRLMRSDSSSDSEESEPRARQASSKLDSRAKSSRERQASLILEKQIRRILAQEAKNVQRESTKDTDGVPIATEAFRQSPLPLGNDEVHKHRNFHPVSGGSIESQDVRRPRTPPGKISPPNVSGFGRGKEASGEIRSERLVGPRQGGIAINISPPRSRSRRRSGTYNSADDMPRDSNSRRRTPQPPRSSLANKQKITVSPSSEDNLSGQSPRTDSSVGHLSPQSASSLLASKNYQSGRAHRKSRDSRDFESRIRGFLRGTRIADIVHPVAKVGDFLWKKDESDADVFKSPISSTPDDSDMDTALERKSTIPIEETAEITSPYGSKSRPELPVFSSPFRSKVTSRQPVGTTGLQSSPELWEGRKSSRFAQIAPPPLDMRSISASPVASREPSTERPKANGEGFVQSRGKELDYGRDSMQRRDAIVNDLSKPPRRQETVYETAIEPKLMENSQWPNNDQLEFLRITERLLSPIKTHVLPKDIYALQRLNESAITVSREIMRQIQEVRVLSSEPQKLDHLARTKGFAMNAFAQAKILQAHGIMQNVQCGSEAIDQAVSGFSKETMPVFVRQLEAIEYKISSELTPIVRNSGNDADKLGSELATTRTLELKRLNDSIDLFIRRKRRRLRWLRRGVYFLLEWTLLGLMWWAWLVVVLIKISRTSIGGFFAAVRWLLWL